MKRITENGGSGVTTFPMPLGRQLSLCFTSCPRGRVPSLYVDPFLSWSTGPPRKQRNGPPGYSRVHASSDVGEDTMIRLAPFHATSSMPLAPVPCPPRPPSTAATAATMENMRSGVLVLARSALLPWQRGHANIEGATTRTEF